MMTYDDRYIGISYHINMVFAFAFMRLKFGPPFLQLVDAVGNLGSKELSFYVWEFLF